MYLTTILKHKKLCYSILIANKPIFYYLLCSNKNTITIYDIEYIQPFYWSISTVLCVFCLYLEINSYRPENYGAIILFKLYSSSRLTMQYTYIESTIGDIINSQTKLIVVYYWLYKRSCNSLSVIPPSAVKVMFVLFKSHCTYAF